MKSNGWIHSLETVLLAIRNQDWKKLNESSLSLVYRRTRTGFFGIITSYRYDVPNEVNTKNQKELEKIVSKNSLAPYYLTGCWQESQIPNTNCEECPKGKLVGPFVTVLFIPNVSKQFIVDLGHKYHQLSVIYCGRDTGHNVMLYNMDGTEKNLGRFNPLKIAQAFSELPGKAREKGKWGKVNQTSKEPGPEKTRLVPRHSIILG